MLRMRVKYASSPVGTFAPSGSSTPVLASVPLMIVRTSLGWNCGSVNTHIDFVFSIFLRISTRRAVPGFYSGERETDPMAFNP